MFIISLERFYNSRPKPEIPVPGRPDLGMTEPGYDRTREVRALCMPNYNYSNIENVKNILMLIAFY